MVTSTGVKLAEDDTSGPGDNARITFLAPQNASYYLRTLTVSTVPIYTIKSTAMDSIQCRFSISKPDSGAVAQAGDTCTLNWSSAYLIDGNVDIFLYKGNNLAGTIQTNALNNGTYKWVVPSQLYANGNDYQIKVIHRIYSTIYGFSKKFTVKN